MKTRYCMVKSLSDVKRLISCCKSTGYASVDWETNAKPLYVAEFKPTILSVSWRPGYGASIICDHFEAEQYIEKGYNWLEAITMFGRAVLENPKITKLAWNWKFDNQIFYKYGIYYQGTVIDGMLAKYLLDEEQPNGLKDMVRRFIPEFADYEKYDNFDSVAWDKKKLEPLCQYGCMDTDATLRLSLFFEKKLIDNGFYKLYRNLLMAASRVLQTTEQHGLLFDKQLNSELKIKYDTIISNSESKLRSNRKLLRYEKHALDERKTAYIEKLEEEIAKLENDKSKNSQRSIQNRREKISRILAGVFKTNDERKLVEPFNFKSVKQLADLLYINKYGFKFPVIEYTVDSKTKKPSENPSTSEAVLLKLKDMDKTDFIQNLLDIRAVQTINSTFIYGLGDLVQDDGCVHPRFLLHGTTSGRLSSREPNGQNIPKTMVNPDVKLQFITPPGKLFLAYDYSQAELRILSFLAKEETMMEWFRTGRDIHLASACKKYHEDYDKIKPIYDDEQNPEYKLWKKRRKFSKQINFGIVYGQTAMKLAESLSTPEEPVSTDEAQVFLDEFFETFPRIQTYMKKQHKFMEKHGYCQSLFGRRRRCPKVYSESYREYLEALRQAVNMPVQSAASDMVYQYIEPRYITPDLIYKLWDICRNPETKEYFGFKITGVDMSMDFTVGRTMAEELPYVPGYDYNKLLSENFNIDEYYAEHNKVKSISISEYPEKFKKYFEESWRTR